LQKIRKFFAPILAMLLVFAFIPAISPAQAATPTFYSLDNDRIRFGNGGESSVNTQGLLQQPFYKSGSSWYQLTHGVKPVDFALGFAGTGTGTWNLNGQIFGTQTSNYFPSNLTIDYSNFVQTAVVGSGVKGYGTVVSRGTVTQSYGGLTYVFEITNTYELGQSSSFVKITTNIKNTGTNTITNLRSWSGTRDDWVGGTDGPTKQRGRIDATNGFINATSNSTENPALKISSGSEAVIFFSPNPGANTAINGCCSFANAYGQNPSTSALSATNDGSYAMFVPFADLAPASSTEMSWYYAAGSTAQIATVVNQVAQAAASWDDQTIVNTAVNGSPYADQVEAGGTGTITYAMASGYSLPPGLNLDTANGDMTGTPTTNGVYTFRISATSVSGSTSSTVTTPDLTLTVGQAPTLASNTLSETIQQGQAYSAAVTATGYPAPTYSIATGSLPAGLSLNATTGAITGTPSTLSTYNFTVKATNVFASTGVTIATASVTVTARPTFTDSTINPRGSISNLYTSEVSAIGSPSPTYSVSAGSLPDGISLNTSTGQLSGTPVTTGDFSFTITATNTYGSSSTSTLSIQVGVGPGVSIEQMPQRGYIGVPVNISATSSGFPTPTFALASGTLPPGVTLNSLTGTLSGIPNTAGSFTFTINASNWVATTSSSSYSITIYGTPVITNVSAVNQTIELGDSFFETLTIDTPTPLSFRIDSGSLPEGIYLDAETGAISGVAESFGRFDLTVSARNESGWGSSYPVTIFVNRAPTMLPVSIDSQVMLDDQYSGQISSTAYPAATYVIDTGSLPEGLTLNPVTGEITGTASGTGTYNFTVLATNAAGTDLTEDLSILVASVPSAVKSTIDSDMNLGSAYSDGIEFDGYPAPSYELVVENSLPSGLSLNPTTGAITGTSSKMGKFSFSILARNEYAVSEPLQLEIEVLKAPTLVSKSVDGQIMVDSPYNGLVKVSAYPAPEFSISSGALPPGLIINQNSGVVSGTATEAGEYKFVIRASNRAGSYDFTQSTISVGEEPKAMVAQTIELIMGTAFETDVSVEAFPTPTYTVLSGNLPFGLSLTSAGVLSGTPLQDGKFEFQVRAQSWAGITDSQALTLEIYSAPTIAAQAIATQTVVATNYSGEISAASYPAATYSLASGQLPEGISLDATTGTLTGEATEVGEFDFTLRASNEVGHVDTAPITLQVGEAPLVVKASAIESPLGADILQNYAAESFPSPTYSLATGELPAGLKLGIDGKLSGTPAESGKFVFTILSTSWAGTTESEQLTIEVTVAPALVSGDLKNKASLAQEYESSIEASGYPNPEYSVVSGALPDGVRLDSATGKIYGIPTKSGTYEFAVRAANKIGNFTFAKSTVVVGAKPGDFSNLEPFELRKGQDFTTDLSVPSVPKPKYTVESGSLPPGLVLTEDGVVQGAPTVAGSYSFKLQAQSWAGTTVSDTIRLDVLTPPVVTSNTVLNEIGKGQSVSFGFASEGFPAPTFKVSEGSLPDGLSLDAATGAITGSATKLGAYSFGILATNSLGSVDAGNFTLLVSEGPKLSPVSLPSVVKLGDFLSQSLEFEGYPLPMASIQSGALPKGLKLSSSGVLSGTATTTGDFSFTIAVGNRLGTVTSSHKMTISKSPSLIIPKPSDLTVGAAFELEVQTTGFPTPTVSLTGELPSGLNFNLGSLTISGTPREVGVFEVTLTASNSLGETSTQKMTLEVRDSAEVTKVTPKISLGAQLGAPIAGSPVEIEAEGAKSGANYIVELHSNPIVLEEGVVPDTGLIFSQTEIPAGLEPGWHRIELRTTGSDDTDVVDAVYFEVTANGLLESLPQDLAPTEEEVAAALTDDAAFLAELGIDPASLVPQEVAQEQTENVVTVVAALTLVAGATAAAASVSAMPGSSGPAPVRAPAAPATGGAAASSSSSSGNTRSGGASPSGGSGGSSGGSSGGKDADGGSDEESSDAGYGNVEGDLDDFTDERSSWGDRLSIWKSTWMTASDHVYFKLANVLSKFSPVAGKVVNDGSYLTAMTGVFSVLPTLVAAILGVVAVSSNEPSIYTSASVLLITVIIALGTIDALAGFVGMVAVIVTSLGYYGFADGGVGRYLLTLAMLGFGPIILSTAFRKIRRNKVENLSGIWERITDLAIIFFISYLTTTSLVGAVSALSAAPVGISEHSQSIGLMVASIATIRVLLEEAAAAGFTARLEHINPTEVEGPSKLQTWFSLLVKYAVLCYMLAPIVGSGWQLWVGAFVIFFPSFVGQFDLQLPTSKFVWQIIPSGLVALTIASLIAGWSGTLVEMLFGELENFKDLSFVLSPIPVIAISLLAMFAEPSKRFYEKLSGSKIIYVVGGIAIYFWTLDVSGFWSALGG
jgi:hypothetical protein